MIMIIIKKKKLIFSDKLCCLTWPGFEKITIFSTFLLPTFCLIIIELKENLYVKNLPPNLYENGFNRIKINLIFMSVFFVQFDGS